MDGVTIRDAGAGDLSEIISVCTAALGWTRPDWDRQLFAWKHNHNAFGESIVLVAEDETGILAVRTLMMWRFGSHQGVVRAARAVDTATRPDAQGRGLFRALTTESLDRLRSQGVAFVFNTPNAASKPGYLKMGWREVGQIDFGIGMRSATSIPRVLRSKVAATKPSEPTPELGIDPHTFLSSLPSIAPQTGGQWRTAHTRETLLWRYVAGPVDYRAIPTSDTAGLIVRVRRRGHARELLVADQIGTIGQDTLRATLRTAMKTAHCTHMIGAARTPGTITSSRVGPLLTMREVSAYNPDPDDMAWTPGDLELF